MPLGPIIKTPPVVWLVPTSGIQFIDFGFTLARSKDLPTQWSFYDDPKASPVPLVGTSQTTGGVLMIGPRGIL